MFNLRQSKSLSLARTMLAIGGGGSAVCIGRRAGAAPPPPSKLPLPKADPPPQRIVTQGLGKTVTEDLIPCGSTRGRA